MPQVRDGTRTSRFRPSRGGQRRARRHDAAVLGWCGSFDSRPRARDVPLDPVARTDLEHARRAVVRVTIFPARLAIDRRAQSEHVHTDRFGHRRCIRVQRRRRSRPGNISARVSNRKRRTGRRTSRPPSRSRRSFCSAKCWNCALAVRPIPQFAGSYNSRLQPLAA